MLRQTIIFILIFNSMSFQSVARGSCTENCALERPFPEERVRPSFPARSRSQWRCDNWQWLGTQLTIRKWQLEHTDFAAATALQKHSGCLQSLPQRPPCFLGTAKPPPSQGTQDANYRELRCKLQLAYPPKNVVPVYAWD